MCVSRDLEKSFLQFSEDEKRQRNILETVKAEETNIRRCLEETMKENRRIKKELDNCEMELFKLENEEYNFSSEQELIEEDLEYRRKQMAEVDRQSAVS